MKKLFGVVITLAIVFFGLMGTYFWADSEEQILFSSGVNVISSRQDDEPEGTVFTSSAQKRLDDIMAGNIPVPGAGTPGYGMYEMLVNSMVGEGYCQEYLSLINQFKNGEHLNPAYVVKDGNKVKGIPLTTILGISKNETGYYPIPGKYIVESMIPFTNGEIQWGKPVAGFDGDLVKLSTINYKMVVDHPGWMNDTIDSNRDGNPFQQSTEMFGIGYGAVKYPSAKTLPSTLNGYNESTPRVSDWYYFPDQLSQLYSGWVSTASTYPGASSEVISLVSSYGHNAGYVECVGISSKSGEGMTANIKGYEAIYQTIMNMTPLYIESARTNDMVSLPNKCRVVITLEAIKDGWSITPGWYILYTGSTTTPSGYTLPADSCPLSAGDGKVRLLEAWETFSQTNGMQNTEEAMLAFLEKGLFQNSSLSYEEAINCWGTQRNGVSGKDIINIGGKWVFNGISYTADKPSPNNKSNYGYIYKVLEDTTTAYGAKLNNGSDPNILVTMNCMTFLHMFDSTFTGSMVLHDMLRYTGMDVDKTLAQIKNAGTIPHLYVEAGMTEGEVTTAIVTPETNIAIMEAPGRRNWGYDTNKYITSGRSWSEWFAQSGVSPSSLNAVQQSIFYLGYTQLGNPYHYCGASWTKGTTAKAVFGKDYTLEEVRELTERKWLNESGTGTATMRRRNNDGTTNFFGYKKVVELSNYWQYSFDCAGLVGWIQWRLGLSIVDGNMNVIEGTQLGGHGMVANALSNGNVGGVQMTKRIDYKEAIPGDIFHTEGHIMIFVCWIDENKVGGYFWALDTRQSDTPVSLYKREPPAVLGAYRIIAIRTPAGDILYNN